MNPDDRAVETLGKLDHQAFIEKIKALPTVDETTQRQILRALLEKHPDIWKKDRKEKPNKKGGKRAAIVREVAEKLGVTLP